MTSTFIDILRDTPIDAIGTDAKKPLLLTKLYLDSLIKQYKKDGPDHNNIAIDELTVDGLDASQVWWQTKMVLDNVEGDLMERIHSLKDAMNPVENEESDDDSIEDNENEQLDEASEEELDNTEDVDELEENDEDESEIIEGKDDYVDSGVEDNLQDEELEEKDEEEEEVEQSQPEDADGVNDQFFNIEEFNRQTLAQENNLDEDDQDDDDEEVDYFADLPSEEDEEADYYEDFFDKPKTITKKMGKKNVDNEEEGDSENDNGFSAMNSVKLDLFEDADEEEDDIEGNETSNTEKLSTYQKQQLEIQKQIEQLETEAIAEKKWALKGEVRAKERPEDALLTEDLEFERTAKPVPVITTDVTESLEEMIRKRIKEFNFDDLQRKTINDFTQRGQRQQVEISDVKSSKSLAEIYADDAQGVSNENAISEELQKSHEEITELFNNISYKLDVLSSAHFVPRPAKKSLEVRVETAAITMEDAQPLSMSSASTLAPQEVYKSGKADNDNEIRLKNGTVMSRDELTREDKNRLRRSVKRKRAKNMSKLPSKKKSKKDDVIETLARAKNITVINKSGEKHDVKGKSKSNGNSNSVTNFRL
ncbi:U3 snoRNP protein [Maudiozyma exigua]|uniref:U3 small nucleolar ribonucleoprotein protein MPP10 n=1 Tax=Maudiozyma exigua TaxID=34358 RepID=A0A9P6VY00_MAUEX|nr:U3 snoRNP protein [Kazachstania exigua]